MQVVVPAMEDKNNHAFLVLLLHTLFLADWITKDSFFSPLCVY
jgi:hypothetical protein